MPIMYSKTLDFCLKIMYISCTWKIYKGHREKSCIEEEKSASSKQHRYRERKWHYRIERKVEESAYFLKGWEEWKNETPRLKRRNIPGEDAIPSAADFMSRNGIFYLWGLLMRTGTLKLKPLANIYDNARYYVTWVSTTTKKRACVTEL